MPQVHRLEGIFCAVFLVEGKAKAHALRDADLAMVEHNVLICQLPAPVDIGQADLQNAEARRGCCQMQCGRIGHRPLGLCGASAT